MDPDISQILETIKVDTDFFSKARAIQALKVDKNVTTKSISEALSMKPSYVCHILRLNKLPPLIVDGYYAGSITLSHLFVISRLKSQDDMISIYEQALSENLTVLQTEAKVRESLYAIKEGGEYLSLKERERLKEDLLEEGVEAQLIQTRIKGKLILEVKGNLQKTTKALRGLTQRLASHS